MENSLCFILGNTVQNDSILIGNLSNTSMALEYERSDMTRRLSILLGELLYIQSLIQEGGETSSEQDFYVKSSELFDNDIFAEELADIICIAIAELPTTLNITNITETLLHVHNGPAIICRLVANFPDCFREGNALIISTKMVCYIKICVIKRWNVIYYENSRSASNSSVCNRW